MRELKFAEMVKKIKHFSLKFTEITKLSNRSSIYSACILKFVGENILMLRCYVQDNNNDREICKIMKDISNFN